MKKSAAKESDIRHKYRMGKIFSKYLIIEIISYDKENSKDAFEFLTQISLNMIRLCVENHEFI